MIPGDGVGPEMMDSVQDVLKAIGAPIDFEVHHLSEVKCVRVHLQLASEANSYSIADTLE